MNEPGVSVIEVSMQDIFDGADLPELWTKLRNRVAVAELPEGALSPIVDDTFGDVYGLYYAVSAPGFSDSEIHTLSSFQRRQ